PYTTLFRSVGVLAFVHQQVADALAPGDHALRVGLEQLHRQPDQVVEIHRVEGRQALLVALVQRRRLALAGAAGGGRGLLRRQAGVLGPRHQLLRGLDRVGLAARRQQVLELGGAVLGVEDREPAAQPQPRMLHLQDPQAQRVEGAHGQPLGGVALEAPGHAFLHLARGPDGEGDRGDALGRHRPEPTSCAIFSTITRILPLPAPASTSSGPSQCRTAADCWGLRPCIRGRSCRGTPGYRLGPGGLRLRRMAKLYFYYSAMNAGNTTTLLQSAHNYRERGMRVAILTPRLDHRDGSGTVASRIGLRADGTPFSRDDDLERMVRASVEQHGPLHCVLVDEAQFLSRSQVWQLTEVVDALRIPVLCYGLRTDFRGELFEGSQYLLAWADEIQEIKTICHSGSKATMTV